MLPTHAAESSLRLLELDALAKDTFVSGHWVPSFVEPTEKNLLLNPAHPSYSAIALTVERHPFTGNPRGLAWACSASRSCARYSA
jgi:hypothetical protein